MNEPQELWWRQVRSDHAVLLTFRKLGTEPCHQLHYLQMVTEKLAKAYFWRSGNPPRKSHAVFVQFLRRLGSCPSSERKKNTKVFGFVQFRAFQAHINAIIPLANALQGLAPALAQDNGPNPEYPWPQNAPQHVPASFEFDVWKQLVDTARGRRFLRMIDDAVNRFPVYG